MDLTAQKLTLWAKAEELLKGTTVTKQADKSSRFGRLQKQDVFKLYFDSIIVSCQRFQNVKDSPPPIRCAIGGGKGFNDYLVCRPFAVSCRASMHEPSSICNVRYAGVCR